MKCPILAAFAACFCFAAPAFALNSPTGIAVDLQGNVYVADTGSQSVAVYGAQAQYIGSLGAGLSNPVSVAVNSVGRVFVADVTQNAVVAYDPGQTTPALTITQYISTPTHVRGGPYDDVWVENYGGQLHVFNPRGSFRVGQNSLGNVTGFTLAGPYAVLVGPSLNGNAGNIVVAENAVDVLTSQVGDGLANNLRVSYGDLAWDSSNQVIWLADRTGHIDTLPISIGLVSNDIVTVASPPYGVAVDPVRNRLYVTEPGLAQVEIFSTKTHKKIGVLR